MAAEYAANGQNDPMRVLAIVVLLCGCSNPEPPPECGSEDFACFRGVFGDLVGTAVEGLELCAVDLDNDCVTTDVGGGFSLPGLPLATDVLITAEHPDFVPTVFPQNTEWDWYAWNKAAVPLWVLDSHAERLGETLDPNAGHVIFLLWEGLNLDGVDTPRVPDVVAELASGGDIFYADGVGLASATATATTGSGSGGALNRPVGTETLTLEAPAGPCIEHSFSYAHDDGIPVPVRAGFISAIDVVCPVE